MFCVQLFLNNINDKKMLYDYGYKYRVKIFSKYFMNKNKYELCKYL